MRRVLFYFLFAAFAFKVFPQIGPGYMGKRFQVGYGFHFSPALLGSNGLRGSFIGRGNAEGGDLAFNSIHEGLVEFAFKNRASVGVSVKYYRSTYDNRTAVYIPVTDYSYNGYSVDSYYPSGFYNIRGLNYTLYFKIFNKRYVAPWGRYFIFGPSINTYKCTYDPEEMYITYRNYSGSGPQVKKFSDFGGQGVMALRGDLLFGWGRSRIAYNRLVIDYGINFQVIALGFTLWDTIGENPIDIITDTDITNSSYMEVTSKSRVREVNRLNVYLKFGFLLF